MERRVKCLIFKDGTFVDELESLAFSREFLYGEGVFTSLWLKEGSNPFWDEHIQRLISGVQKQFGVDASLEINELVDRLKSKFKEDTYLRISLSFDGRNYPFLKRDFKSEDLQVVIHFDSMSSELTSVDCRLVEINYPDMSIKSPQYQAQLRAVGNEVPIFYDSDGVAEAISSNCFFIKDNEIFTPYHPRSLQGIIKKSIVNEFSVKEALIRSDEVLSFNSAFLTNSVKLVQKVASINGKRASDNPIIDDIFRYIQGIYDKSING